MLLKEANAHLTPVELAHLGHGEVAYIRKISAHDVTKHFPEAPPIHANAELWALFGADGTPILLTDNRSSTFFKAAEDELRTICLH